MIDFDEQFMSHSFDDAFCDESKNLLQKIGSQKRYTDGEDIACGGMKRIVNCFDSFTDRELARAYPLNDKTKLNDFLNEIRLASKLEHPNIVPLYDMGVEDGQIYFIMKKLSGSNLQDLISSSTKNSDILPLNQCLEIFLKLCDAISFAHSKNILHLDIKPANIQVDDYGQVLLCDWGLARDLSDCDTVSEDLSTQDMHPVNLELSYNNKIKGTPGYMAPEQTARRFGSRSSRTDIYSLGGVLYFLLSFKKPLEGETLEQLIKKTQEGDFISPRQRCPDLMIPTALNSVVLKAMALKPENRYLNVAELANDIRSYLSGFATSAEDASFLKQLKLLIKRNKTLFTLGSIALSFIVLLTAYFITQLKEEKLTAESAKFHAEEMAQKSIISESEARRAQKESEESTLQALGLVEDLQTEKKYSSTLKNQAAEELMEKAFTPFRHNKNYFKATETINLVLQLQPNNQEAIYHLALMEMGAFKFKQIKDLLKSYHGEQETSWITEAISPFFDKAGRMKPYTWQQQLNLANQLLDSSYNADKQYVAWHINSSIHNKFEMPDCIKYARASMAKRNKSSHFQFTADKLSDASYRVSIARSLCAPYEEIRHWKISELDLSHSNFRNLTILWNSPLKKLNIAHTPVNSLNKIWTLPLEVLNIKGTKISDYEAIYQYPLQALTINEFCSDLKRLNSISTLRELILPQAVYSPQEITKLSKNIKVTFYNYDR
ncbi:serine/threonine-protein kinase [Lentisphaera profundi]|uniref:Serine/threonine-protein kinase n=1 Tax=Lentisphaera profundi TaxID=1658616 RepID=A0ABY7VZQ2_9BACT|nr:serine/threonine-protein kinase [Lentisphaera profundi]WDE98680.1 serine/threonine-protein kinase [Lentisphaera profundi]